MTRHADRTALAARMADTIFRYMADLRFQWATDAAQAAAYRLLADTEIAAGLRDTDLLAELGPRLAALDALHSPRRWAHSDVVVCDHCNRNWPCESRRLLDGKAVKTWPTWEQVRDLPLHVAGVKR